MLMSNISGSDQKYADTIVLNAGVRKVSWPDGYHQANTLGIGTKQQSFEAARGKAENVKGATAAEKDVRMIHAY